MSHGTYKYVTSHMTCHHHTNAHVLHISHVVYIIHMMELYNRCISQLLPYSYESFVNHVTYACVMSNMSHVTNEWVMSRMNESHHTSQIAFTLFHTFASTQICIHMYTYSLHTYTYSTDKLTDVHLRTYVRKYVHIFDTYFPYTCTYMYTYPVHMYTYSVHMYTYSVHMYTYSLHMYTHSLHMHTYVHKFLTYVDICT